MRLVLGIFRWLISYTVAAVAAGLTFTLFAVISTSASEFIRYSLGTESCDEADGCVRLTFSDLIGIDIFFLVPFFIIFALPAVTLLMGLPELFGVKPEVKKWAVLGIASAFLSYITVFTASRGGFSEVLNEIYLSASGASMEDMFAIMGFVLAGLVGGSVLGKLRSGILK